MHALNLVGATYFSSRIVLLTFTWLLTTDHSIHLTSLFLSLVEFSLVVPNHDETQQM